MAVSGLHTRLLTCNKSKLCYHSEELMWNCKSKHTTETESTKTTLLFDHSWPVITHYIYTPPLPSLPKLSTSTPRFEEL